VNRIDYACRLRYMSFGLEGQLGVQKPEKERAGSEGGGDPIKVSLWQPIFIKSMKTKRGVQEGTGSLGLILITVPDRRHRFIKKVLGGGGSSREVNKCGRTNIKGRKRETQHKPPEKKSYIPWCDNN